MNESLYTFEPVNQNFGLLWTALVLLLIAGLASLRLFTQKKGKTIYTDLGAMLLGFVALIALVTAIFTGWTVQRTGTVAIYNQAIELQGERIAFKDLQNAVIEQSQQPAFFGDSNAGKVTFILLIQQRGGKTYALSEENYPVREVMAKLKKAVSDWEKRE